MFMKNSSNLNVDLIKKRLNTHKKKFKLSLKACAHCSLCAESCFLYMSHDKDPKYTPSYKFINSIGLLYKKKGKVDKNVLEEIKCNVWERCALCTRCYCPVGINIPEMIATARSICREQGVYPDYGA